MNKIKYITNKEERILKAVIELGDKNSKTLGHLPRSVYREYARKKRIVVILGDNSKLLGYTLFDTVKTKDKIRIVHLCLDQKERGNGYAKELLDELKSKYFYLFSKISLTCRQDYATASKFWKNYGFIQGLKKKSRSNQKDRYTNSR